MPTTSSIVTARQLLKWAQSALTQQSHDNEVVNGYRQQVEAILDGLEGGEASGEYSRQTEALADILDSSDLGSISVMKVKDEDGQDAVIALDAILASTSEILYGAPDAE